MHTHPENHKVVWDARAVGHQLTSPHLILIYTQCLRETPNSYRPWVIGTSL